MLLATGHVLAVDTYGAGPGQSFRYPPLQVLQMKDTARPPGKNASNSGSNTGSRLLCRRAPGVEEPPVLQMKATGRRPGMLIFRFSSQISAKAV